MMDNRDSASNGGERSSGKTLIEKRCVLGGGTAKDTLHSTAMH